MRGLNQGFSLLELLVSLALVATLASLTSFYLTGVGQRERESLSRFDLNKLAKAVLQFHRDTGYWPKTGPFRLLEHGGKVSPDSLPDASFGGASVVARQQRQREWFYHPANLTQLLSLPLTMDASDELVAVTTWQPALARGWRGPYLQSTRLALVDVANTMGMDYANTTAIGVGSLVDGLDASELLELPALADHINRFEPMTASFADDSEVLDWRLLSGNYTQLSRRGRMGGPYLYFPPAKPSEDIQLRPRLVYLGANGRYDALPAANFSNWCERQDDVGNAVDDYIVCL